MSLAKAWSSRRSRGDLILTYFAWLVAAALFLLIRLYGTNEYLEWVGSPGSIALMLVLSAGVLATFDWMTNHWMDESRMRNLPYWILLVFRAVFFLLAIAVIVFLGRLTAIARGTLTWPEFPNAFREHLLHPRIVGGAAYVAVCSVVIGFFRQSAAMIGPRILRNLMLGRYRHPREEELIFMFLDMKASTTHAERLGHRKFSELLQDCFRDLTDAALKHQVEIYKYVGDEAILTWRPRDGLRDCNCLATFFSFRRILEDRRQHYEGTYHCFPEFKAGVNIGPVTVAEVGVLRREIAYLSDVLNTAARIQGECNRLQCPLLITPDLRDRLPADHSYALDSKGTLPLRGKEAHLEVLGVSE